MKCPKCGNKDYQPLEGYYRGIKNLGNKEQYDTVDYRRYVCLQCGYKFLTAETFFREMGTRNAEQAELFEAHNEL